MNVMPSPPQRTQRAPRGHPLSTPPGCLSMSTASRLGPRRPTSPSPPPPPPPPPQTQNPGPRQPPARHRLDSGTPNSSPSRAAMKAASSSVSKMHLHEVQHPVPRPPPKTTPPPLMLNRPLQGPPEPVQLQDRPRSVHNGRPKRMIVSPVVCVHALSLLSQSVYGGLPHLSQRGVPRYVPGPAQKQYASSQSRRDKDSLMLRVLGRAPARNSPHLAQPSSRLPKTT